MNDLHDLLDDAVRDEARAVRIDATRAWASGRRRRSRRRLELVTATAVALIALLALPPALSVFSRVALPTSSSGDDNSVSSHPGRIDYVYRDRTLPNASGRLAGLVQRNREPLYGWYAVSQSGGLWRIPVTGDDVPTLSPDGTHLAYMHGPESLAAEYRIVDQTTGKVTEFNQISVGIATDPKHRWFHSGQQPAYWSPDNTRVLLQIGNTRRNDPLPDPAAFVLDTDGTVTRIERPRGADSAMPLGWIDKDHVAIFRSSGEDPVSVRIWVVSVDSGQAVRTFVLDDGRADYPFGQWLGAISPDGSTLATLSTPQGVPAIRLHALEGPGAGRVTSDQPGSSQASDTCLPVWSSSGAYLSTMTSLPSEEAPAGEPAVLVAKNDTTPIIADPRLGIVCSAWAPRALDGPAHASWGSRLFGQRSTWLSWHWREAALSILLATLLCGGGLLAARELRRRRPLRP